MDEMAPLLAHDRIGTGPPLVLLHAGIADRRMWEPQVAGLSHAFTLIPVDLRGFGESPPATGEYAHHVDLAALLDHLGLERVGVAGCSFGGEVAARFALTNPERTGALALIATRAGAIRPSKEVMQAWDDADTAFEQGDLEGAIEIELRTWVDGPFRAPDAVDPVLRERVREMNRANWQRDAAETPSPELPFEPPARERVQELKMPVLLVSGALDQPDVARSMAVLTSRIPTARSVTIEHAAHLPTMERPEVCNAELLAFFQAAL